MTKTALGVRRAGHRARRISLVHKHVFLTAGTVVGPFFSIDSIPQIFNIQSKIFNHWKMVNVTAYNFLPHNAQK